MKNNIYFYLTLILYYVATSNVEAQISWEKLYLPHQSRVIDIVGNNQGEIFISLIPNPASCDTVILYRTINNYTSWEKVFSTPHACLLDINNKQEIFFYFNKFYKIAPTGTVLMEFEIPNIGSNLKCIGSDSLLIYSFIYNENLNSNYNLLIRTPDFGVTIDTLYFEPYDGTSYFRGIEYYPPNDIFFAIEDFPVMGMDGGVFHSKDNGLSWYEIGLKGQEVTGIAVNNQGDLFASSWQSLDYFKSPGVFALYYNNDTITQSIESNLLTDIVTTSKGYIFVSRDSDTENILLSTDNGVSFSICSNNTESIDKLYCDGFDYVYAIPKYNKNFIYRTSEPIVSVIQKEKFQKTEVYPNPFKDKVTLKISDNKYNKLKIELVDILGKVLYYNIHQLIDNRIEIDTKNIPAGIYICKVSSGTELISVNKIIKTK